MRVAIPHSHPKEEVRRRLRERVDEITGFLPGGVGQVTTSWPSEDRMDLTVVAMGQTLPCHVDVEEGQMVLVIDLPFALSFLEPMIKDQVRDKAQKMLASD